MFLRAQELQQHPQTHQISITYLLFCKSHRNREFVEQTFLLWHDYSVLPSTIPFHRESSPRGWLGGVGVTNLDGVHVAAQTREWRWFDCMSRFVAHFIPVHCPGWQAKVSYRQLQSSKAVLEQVCNMLLLEWDMHFQNFTEPFVAHRKSTTSYSTMAFQRTRPLFITQLTCKYVISICSLTSVLADWRLQPYPNISRCWSLDPPRNTDATVSSCPI